MLTPHTLSGKFRTAFFLIALIPVLIIGVVTYMQLRARTIERETRSLYAITESRRLALDIWIEGLRLRISSIRSLPDLAVFTRSQRGSTGAGERQLDASLRENIPSKEDISGIYLFAPDGRITYSFVKDHDNRTATFAHEEFFLRGAVQDYFSGVILSPVSGSRCFLFSYPIRDVRGTLLAVLGVETSVDRLMRIFGAQSETMEGVALSLLQLDGTVVYQSTGPIHFPISQKNHSAGLADVDRKKAVAGLFAGGDGQSILASYLLSPEQQWIITAELPTATALQTANMLLYSNMVVVLVLIVVILVVARYYGNRFAAPIVSLNATADLIANGDLRRRVAITSSDEVGKLATSFNGMVDSLASMNSSMLSMSSDIGRATGDILASSSEQEQITLQQSSAVSQTSATVEELSVSAKQVSYSAQSIMQQVEGTAAKIMYFSQKAQEINKISAVIDEIAQQIHLLSLNASIESARAGEHGRGFGVVAAEIRKLSENANRQTSEIAAIVQDIQDAISTVVLATEQAVNGVRSITISVQEQDTATEQIAMAMQEINTGMKQSLEGTKQTLHSVEELNSVMKNMDDLVRHFKLT